jgi:hypothetical protein
MTAQNLRRLSRDRSDQAADMPPYRSSWTSQFPHALAKPWRHHQIIEIPGVTRYSLVDIWHVHNALTCCINLRLHAAYLHAAYLHAHTAAHYTYSYLLPISSLSTSLKSVRQHLLSQNSKPHRWGAISNTSRDPQGGAGGVPQSPVFQ